MEIDGASLILDKHRVYLSSIKSTDKNGYQLELADYRSIGGRRLPATLKLYGGGFSFVFRLSRPSVRFQ